MELVLKLKNGGKEEFTMDEARELYNELHQIFGGKQTQVWPHVKPFDPLDIYGPIYPTQPPCGDKTGEYEVPQTWFESVPYSSNIGEALAKGLADG